MYINIGAYNKLKINEEETYLGEDGLLYCCKCKKQVQCNTYLFTPNGPVAATLNCTCGCYENEEKKRADKAREEMHNRARRVCFGETNMMNWTFANDNGNNKQLSDAMETYAKKFCEFQKNGQGLLLWGSVGTGKTYYAACIANRLIDQGYKAYMTSISRLTNLIQGSFDEKQELIDDLNRYDLLVIDDLGTERKTEYTKEMVFSIIDARYRSGLPLIVTTNITLDEFKKQEDLDCRRIYDRILERCFPVEMNGKSNRREIVKERYFEVKEKLGL